MTAPLSADREGYDFFMVGYPAAGSQHPDPRLDLFEQHRRDEHYREVCAARSARQTTTASRGTPTANRVTAPSTQRGPTEASLREFPDPRKSRPDTTTEPKKRYPTSKDSRLSARHTKAPEYFQPLKPSLPQYQEPYERTTRQSSQKPSRRETYPSASKTSTRSIPTIPRTETSSTQQPSRGHTVRQYTATELGKIAVGAGSVVAPTVIGGLRKEDRNRKPETEKDYYKTPAGDPKYGPKHQTSKGTQSTRTKVSRHKRDR
jgi:hypothetical protein